MSKALGAVVFTSTAAMARVVVVCTAGFLLERHGHAERRTVAYIVFYFLSVWAIAFLICFLMTQFLLRVSS